MKTEMYIPQYDWYLIVYYCSDYLPIEDIYDDLLSIGCQNVDRTIYPILSQNSGLTFSNKKLRVTIIIIGIADSTFEYQNTIAHEVAHLAQHINEVENLDEEEFAELIGEVQMKLLDYTKAFICKNGATER